MVEEAIGVAVEVATVVIATAHTAAEATIIHAMAAVVAMRTP